MYCVHLNRFFKKQLSILSYAFVFVCCHPSVISCIYDKVFSFWIEIFLYSSTYAWLISYHIIEVKSSRENMKKKEGKEDASSDQLLPDTFYVYQFPFII